MLMKMLFLLDIFSGIDLDPQSIECNPGKRFVAKLCLNSFWGKFAQKSDVTQAMVITDPKIVGQGSVP